MAPKSFADFAIDCAGFSAALPESMGKATADAALMVTSSARDAIRAATGGDSRLSGMGNARVGARFTMRDKTTALVSATGPMQIIESDTKAHVILPKGIGSGFGRSKAGRRAAKQSLYDALFGGTYSGVKPLRTPWGPRYRVSHPGTKGKHTWANAIDAAAPRVPLVYEAALQKHMRRHFG